MGSPQTATAKVKALVQVVPELQTAKFTLVKVLPSFLSFFVFVFDDQNNQQDNSEDVIQQLVTWEKQSIITK
jgi:hypothetical protein